MNTKAKITILSITAITAAGLVLYYFGNKSELYMKALEATTRLAGALDAEQTANLRAIVAANEKYNASDKGAQLAYIIATAWGESRLRLLREGPSSTDAIARRFVAGRSYGKVINGHVFYGRGFPQLTFDYNYKRMGDILGYDLYNNPDKALERKVSAEILVYGMVHGIFRGHKLSDYITDAGPNDYYNARNIVNSKLDKASTFRNYAHTLLNA